MSTARRPPHLRTRRGSTYILILGISVILMVIGLSAVTVSRVNTRTVVTDNHWAEAQVLAFSGVEHALATVQATSDWREKFANTEQTVHLAGGSFRWRVVDEADGDLTDNDAEPFLIVARGEVGQGAYAMGLQCTVQGEPLEALGCALHCDGEVRLSALRKVTAANGPVSTNRKLKTSAGSVLTGDVEAARSVTGSGTITGTVTTPVPKKPMPDKDVFNVYRDLATAIEPGTQISRQVLAPGLNPWGAPNARGIYFIDARGKHLLIEDVRIYGTLVVRCRRLSLSGTILMHPFRKDQPTLIVDGDVTAYMTSAGQTLREGGANPNFNPIGAPYNGQVDTDRNDAYPSELQGLIHVLGKLDLGGTTRVRGVVLAEKTTHFDGDNEIIHDPDIHENPPMGYTFGTGQAIPQIWKRILD